MRCLIYSCILICEKMTQVFIISYGEDFEGSHVIAVASSIEKALELMSDYLKKYRQNCTTKPMGYETDNYFFRILTLRVAELRGDARYLNRLSIFYTISDPVCSWEAFLLRQSGPNLRAFFPTVFLP